LIGSALGYAMDGFDLLILGFMLNSISADLSLTPAQGASLVTATLIGAVIGGIGFGMLRSRGLVGPPWRSDRDGGTGASIARSIAPRAFELPQCRAPAARFRRA
jgi:MFS family permease